MSGLAISPIGWAIKEVSTSLPAPSPLVTLPRTQAFLPACPCRVLRYAVHTSIVHKARQDEHGPKVHQASSSSLRGAALDIRSRLAEWYYILISYLQKKARTSAPSNASSAAPLLFPSLLSPPPRQPPTHQLKIRFTFRPMTHDRCMPSLPATRAPCPMSPCLPSTAPLQGLSAAAASPRTWRTPASRSLPLGPSPGRRP
jgi:hypothetical protein